MKRYLSFLLLICWLAPVWAVSTMHTIELKHRTPAEVLPQIEALLPEDAAVSSFDNTIVLRSDGATFEDVRRVLDVLDKPQQNITVSVVRSQQQLSDQQRRDDRLVFSENSAGVAINRWSTRDSRDRDQQLQVRGLAGEPVEINTGQLIAQREQLVIFRPWFQCCQISNCVLSYCRYLLNTIAVMAISTAAACSQPSMLRRVNGC